MEVSSNGGSPVTMGLLNGSTDLDDARGTPQWTARLVAGAMLLLCIQASCIVGLRYQTYSRVCCLDNSPKNDTLRVF